VSTDPPARGMLGILGGLGPYAGADFVRTIYDVNTASVEQEQPRCVLCSDPSIPDRTTAILAGDTAPVAAALVEALERLVRAGADRIVIACTTIHHFLPDVPEPLRRRVLSLIDVTLDEIARRGIRQVLLCTSGTRRAQIFERHPRWPGAAPFVVFPSEADQAVFHDMLYRIKTTGDGAAELGRLREIAGTYDAESVVAGCTELHLVTRAHRAAGQEKPAILDPLWLVAERLGQLVEA